MDQQSFKEMYPGTGPPCCVCGDPSLNMTHEADGDDRRYCSPACVGKAHPLSTEQIAKLRLLLGIDQIKINPKKEEKPKISTREVDRMIAALPREPGPNAGTWQRSSVTRRKSYDLVCPTCGKEFVGHHSMTVYCSKICRNKGWSRQLRQKRKESQLSLAPLLDDTDQRARERLRLMQRAR